LRRLSPLLLLFLIACSGIHASNVGEPHSGEKLRFMRSLDQLEIGMPEDSITALFTQAEEPGQVGILHRSSVRFDDFERVTYQLGWKSEPRHQGAYKRPEDIDQILALVEIREGQIFRIKRDLDGK
jgi:hypothetical protein